MLSGEVVSAPCLGIPDPSVHFLYNGRQLSPFTWRNRRLRASSQQRPSAEAGGTPPICSEGVWSISTLRCKQSLESIGYYTLTGISPTVAWSHALRSSHTLVQV